MREIKFRGKDLNGEGWVYGSYVFTDDDKNNPSNSRIKQKHQIVQYNAGDWGMGQWVYYDVDPETVGKYTGFTDKNGAQVFEGDLVEALDAAGDPYDGKGVGAIEWLGSFGYWNVSEIELSLGDLNYEGYIKVIGNIHDNKDLLKLD